MKTIAIKYLLILGLYLAIFSPGCTDEFLEKPAGGAVTTDTIFTTQNQAQYAVARMYQDCLRGYYVSSDYASAGRQDLLTDQVFITDNTYWICAAINSNGSYYQGTMTASNNNDLHGFGAHYRGIRRANLVLRNIDMVTDAEPGWIDDVKGQALFLRAWQHFELFRYYGGVPIVTEILGEGEVKLPRRSIESVVNTIVSWCDEAAVLMPSTRSPAEYGKVTSLAAKALKARVLLYAASPLYNTPPERANDVMGARFGSDRDSVVCYPTYDANRWKLAADAAQDVLSLASEAGVALHNTGKVETTGDVLSALGDYEYVWNSPYENSEMILINTARAMRGDWSGGTARGLFALSKAYSVILEPGNPWGIMNHTPIEFATLYEKRDGSKWDLDVTDTGDDLPTYLEGLDLDPRFYQSIAYDGKVYNSNVGRLEYFDAGDGFQSGKLNHNDQASLGFAMETYKYCGRIEGGDTQHLAWPVFRLAEFYLSYAEAMNEFSGPSQAVYDALNMTRRRAGMPDKAGLSKEALREAIQNERTVELAFENHRYNDLLRWLKARETLNKQFHGIKTRAKRGDNDELLRSWYISLYMNRSFPMKYYYVPFPNSEISMDYLGGGNDWDGQNPGW